MRLKASQKLPRSVYILFIIVIIANAIVTYIMMNYSLF